MRLKPGITLEHAQEELREALNLLTNAQSGQRYESPWQSYMIAVDQALPHLAVFTEPDLARGLLSPTYWHLLPVAGIGPEAGRVVYRELRTQIATLELAEEELLQLKQYAERPGVPVVLDTNILNWWEQPHTINWRQLFKDEGIDASSARLVVPLVVIEELDRQKYGAGLLAKRAATAIRYLDHKLTGITPGEPVKLTDNATLEVSLGTRHGQPGMEADTAILTCAADLDQLLPNAGTRVLTDDTNMRLRAAHMGLQTLRLPERHRKPGTAMSDTEP
ncbi:PIN domain-containing protein [Streptomyces griseorubiginosus]|uniref:PIN domain-containing protein n=1 Tax=Streptomyces griseorubiginosus TaxID=67304 RepID=UPI0015E8609D|nr:PIN domain-containing protein [Streptomyces griseorubiginosus]